MSELLRISVPCLLTGSEGQNASLQKATCLIDPQNTILLPVVLSLSRRGHSMKSTELCLIRPSLLPQ